MTDSVYHLHRDEHSGYDGYTADVALDLTPVSGPAILTAAGGGGFDGPSTGDWDVTLTLTVTMASPVNSGGFEIDFTNVYAGTLISPVVAMGDTTGEDEHLTHRTGTGVGHLLQPAFDGTGITASPIDLTDSDIPFTVEGTLRLHPATEPPTVAPRWIVGSIGAAAAAAGGGI